MSFKEFVNESVAKSIKADYVMIHYPPGYDASVTPFDKKDLDKIVSEDNGFDHDDISAILRLSAKKSWERADVQILRIK